jgi:transcriptional regulator with XRE-family HTH domain
MLDSLQSRNWLAGVRQHLGLVTDAEIARRAGVSESAVLFARRELRIPARQGRDLDAVSPNELLRRIRARARAGKAMRAFDLGSTLLVRMSQRHFGGWYQAVAAAGLRPAGKPRKTITRAKKRAFTPAMLRGPMSAAEIEHMTGLSRDAIRSRRKAAGIVRRERREPDRSWVPGVRKLLGKLPDAEVGKRVGKSASHIQAVRKELGIPAAPRLRAVRITKGGLRGLHPTDALILRERYMRKPPATLPELAKRLGVSKQRVAQRETRALARIERSSRSAESAPDQLRRSS